MEINTTTLVVKGWEKLTTKQIGKILETEIEEKEKAGIRVKKIICGNVIISLPNTPGKVTEAYLWPKLLARFNETPVNKQLITVED